MKLHQHEPRLLAASFVLVRAFRALAARRSDAEVLLAGAGALPDRKVFVLNSRFRQR